MKTSRIALVALSMQGIGLMARATPAFDIQPLTREASNQRDMAKSTQEARGFFKRNNREISSGIHISFLAELAYATFNVKTGWKGGDVVFPGLLAAVGVCGITPACLEKASAQQCEWEKVRALWGSSIAGTAFLILLDKTFRYYTSSTTS